MKTRALPLRSRAPQGLEEIWNSNQRKLAVFVVECDEHVTDKDKLPLSITLNWGKIKQQTSQRKSEKSKNTVWNEFFLFSIDSGGPELTVEVVKSKKLGKDEVLGSAAVFHANEPPPEEKVIDLWVPLHRDSKKKVQVTSGEAKIHIRLLYSCSSETRPVEERGQQVFNYDDYVKQFKTGDLVLYSGIGLIHTYNKLLTNSEYSHAGLIFRLPNKWTRRDDVYVLEAQRNIDGFLDAFVEKPNSGLSLFRFFERIHQFHGLKIWFCPLTPSATFDSKVLVTEMWKTHSANIESSTRAQLGSRSGKQSETDKVYLLDRELSKELQGGSLSRTGLSDSGEKEKGRNFALVELLEGHHFQMKAPGIRFQLIDLLDAKLITTLLRRAGMGELTDKPRPKGTLIYPADVAEYKCYGKPVLIRDVDLNAEPKEESESGALPQQYYVVQNPMPMQFMPMMPQQGVPMGLPQQGFMPQQQQQQQFSPLQQQQLMQQQLLQQQQQQQMLQQQQQQQLLQQQQQQQLMQQQQLQQMQQQQRLSMPQVPQGFQQQPQYNPFMQQQGQQPPPLQPQRHSLENMFAPQHSPSYPSLTEQSNGNPPPFNPEFIEQVKASAGDEKNEKRKSPTILIH